MSGAVRLRLELLGEGARGQELPATGTLVVGSSAERAGFVVAGQGVEDAHCAIGRTREGDFAIKDLGTRYGTLVNGQRVSSARLKAGDQILLGSRRLELVLVAPQAAAPPRTPERPAEWPERIGGYRIERLIGRGAMGSVYLAVQESLRRPVALKVLLPRLAADRDFVLRFQAEARAAAALSHPNVVVVYDVGESNGAHYLSMEYMAGGSLEQKLAAGGPLAWKSVLDVLSDAAAGLSYAESRGIVHRDIKPANLMYSGTGTVKIADLGLATTLEQEASEGEGGRKVFGTPHFISPEQARGEPVDQRSDLYSLGATAYRLLSGRTPFEGATTREILRALQNENPRPLRELVPDLPPELAALVARLMEKDPRARFPSAEALRRECERLRLLVEHGPALVQHERASRLQLGFAAVLLVIVLGALGTWYALGRATRPGPGAAGAPHDQPLATAAGQPEEPDGDFFGPEPAAAPRDPPDEEQALREREREAARALAELSPFLPRAERQDALRGIAARYGGTEAAAAAAAELASLSALPPEDGPDPEATLLESTLRELAVRVGWPPAEGALPGPVAALQELSSFIPPASLGAEFSAQRQRLAGEIITGSERLLRAELARREELSRGGTFEPLRAVLPALAAALEGLDSLSLPAGMAPEALQGLRLLAEEVRMRQASLALEEELFRAAREQELRRSLQAALGSNSGLSEELGALDLAAVERRLAALPPELSSRPGPMLLARELALARSALEALGREFAAGGWRRKTVLDPRTRKPREVRDVRPEGLVFGEGSTLEALPWSAARGDPEWWQQLYHARLVRDWSPEEVRGIVALLRLSGAARGAELARLLIAPGGRGLLQPAELEELARVFAPALEWLRGGAAGLEEAALALEGEAAAAALLAQALDAAQEKRWSGSVAALERCLAEHGDSLLVVLLSDGSEWRPAPPEAGR